jgi:hypothetical protein
MRYAATILFAFFLLAFQEPSLANANRGRVVKTGVGTKAARPVAAARTKATAKVRPAARKIAKGFAKLGKKTVASVKLRNSIRAKRSETNFALSRGELSVAAVEVSRSPLRNAKGQFVKGPKKLSIRERFALYRTTRAVKKAALKQTKGRSKSGDLQGTADALQALGVLEAKGKLGVFGRWQKARATKRAFKNLNKAARSALKRGEVDAAGQSFAFAAEMGVSARQTKKTAKALVKESFTLAKAYAKSGNPDLTWKSLEMAAAIAVKGGAKFSEKKAQALVDKSFVNALPVLTKAARKAYKSGELDQAIQMLAEARAIQRGGSAKPSRSVIRQQNRLVRNLGPRLNEFEAAQAQAEQAQAEQAAE